MKWKCETCDELDPCVLKIDGESTEVPLICPFKMSHEQNQAKWEEIKEVKENE